MPECRKLGTVRHGPACGCPDNACILDVQDGQWPHDSSIEDTLDTNLENEKALSSWVLVKPHGVKVHQRAFTVPALDRLDPEVLEEAWQAAKDAALARLLEDNGLQVTYDQYFDQQADQQMGRWTLEEVIT